jgi:hypothetical protein
MTMNHWLFGAATSTLLFFGLMAVLPAALAQTIKVASWNLGWHVSSAELPSWIATCNKLYSRQSNGQWVEASSQDSNAVTGWEITESRAKIESLDMKKMPPCGVYRANGLKGNLPVSAKAYAKRNQQLAELLRDHVSADLIAFQEVSGAQAVREALGEQSSEYEICSFDEPYKIQRLAFAWRKAKLRQTQPCKVHAEIALGNAAGEQPLRPGLSMVIQAGSKTIRVLTLHLKSGCVSPLEKGKLDGAPQNKMRKGVKLDDPCPTLQQQIEPLEKVIETLGQGVDHFIVIGDINRNLWHELNAPDEPIRSNNSDPTSALGSATTNNLYREINDGQPTSSRMTLVKLSCSTELNALCDFSTKGILKGPQRQELTNARGLGCRNGIGLDHALVSESLTQWVKSAKKISIGRYGNSRAPNSASDVPLLSVSDHCPIVLTLQLN